MVLLHFKCELGSPSQKQLLCDAQTSGGLLIAINKKDVNEYLNKIQELSFGYASIVGEIVPRRDKEVIVI